MNTTVNPQYIDIQGVEQTFKTKKGPFCALQNVNLKVAKGEFVALIDAYVERKFAAATRPG